MNHPRFGLAYTNKFTKVWNDQGSRAKLDLTIWRPYLAPFGFLGDYPVGSYNEPIHASTAYIHAVVDDDPANPALWPPERLEPIWFYPAPSPFPLPPPLNEVKVICRPVAPKGYVACGFVGATARTGQDLTKLIVPGLMCVRSDLTVNLFNPPYRPATPPISDFVWNDHGSRLPNNVSVFRVESRDTGIATMWAASKYMTAKDRVSSYFTIRPDAYFPMTPMT
jgi:hypothetical protein